jgi:outer membrane protein
MRTLRPAILATTLLCPFAAQAAEPSFHAGDFLVRAKMSVVHPFEEATIRPTGGTLHVDTIMTPAVDFTYFLQDNIAVEFIPAILQHHAKITGSRVGDKNLGSVWAIAPTLLLQYHEELRNGIKPYIGLGMAYVTYLEDTDMDIEYDNAVAGIAQLGVDIALDKEKRWWANMDVKKVWAGTTSHFNGNAATGDITLNPVSVGVGIGYRF